MYNFPLQKEYKESTLIKGDINGNASGDSFESNTTLGNIPFNGINDFIDLGNRRDECFGNLDLCTHGYSLKLDMHHPSFNSDKNITYCVSSGGSPDSLGIAVYFISETEQVGVIFQTSTTKWEAIIEPNGYNLFLTWSVEKGLFVYRRFKLLGEGVKTTRNFTTDKHQHFMLGKPNFDDDMHAKFVLASMTFWSHFKEEEAIKEIYVEKGKVDIYCV